MNSGPSWQWPQKPAAHFMFRSIDTKMRPSGIPARASGRTENRIIASGPQMNANVDPGSRTASAISSVTTPTRPFQSDPARSTITCTSSPDAGSPFQADELVAKQEIRRGARADQDHHPPVTVAVAKRVIDDRPQRRQPQAPGDQQEIAPRGDVDGPRLSEGTAHAHHLAGRERAQGARHGAERPYRVHGVGRGRIAAHRDRRLAHAERVQHVELAGGERAARRRPFQPQGHHVGDLVVDGADADRHGNQPLVDGGGGVHGPVR